MAWMPITWARKTAMAGTRLRASLQPRLSPIAFVGGFADSSAREERAGGVAEFLNDRGLTLNADHSVVCEPARPQAGRRRCGCSPQIPDVDGVVCFSDVVAFGVLDAIADLGRTIGSDVRVIGFDDVHDAGSIALR